MAGLFLVIKRNYVFVIFTAVAQRYRYVKVILYFVDELADLGGEFGTRCCVLHRRVEVVAESQGNLGRAI